MVSLMSTSINIMVSLKRSNNRSRNDCDGHSFLRRESKDTQCTEEPLLTVSSLGDVEEDSISFSSSSSLTDDDGELQVIQVELDTTVHSGAATPNTSKGNTDLERPSLVQFSTVEIRNYRMVLGDNPSVTSGVPVTLDWLYDECMVCDVSDYEDSRPPRRDRAQMMLPAEYRARLVMDTGSSRKEIQQRQKEVNIQRSQRRRTLELEHFDSQVDHYFSKRSDWFIDSASSAFSQQVIKPTQIPIPGAFIWKMTVLLHPTVRLYLSLLLSLRIIHAFHIHSTNPLVSVSLSRRVPSNLAFSSSSSSPTNDDAIPTDPEALFEMEGWKNIADDLHQFPLFAVATPEGIPVAYQVTLNEEQTYNIPFFFCSVEEALQELDNAKQINRGSEHAEDMKIVPFPLGTAFRLWCTDQAVIVPSKASITQAGAPPGTNPIGQTVPMWACLEISEEMENGKPRLPIFMDLEDANAAVMEAVGADGGKLDDFEVVCLSLSGAIEQLATVPEDTPSFHFIPPSSSLKYIEEYQS
ncbi:hypothetical protein IV203_020781 [Nitzschia inconspicua]|uniref:Uncharacterized protein n=1 Tax=Nitzschia inconspicua TaxID=303405 RepID=A0A9K3PCP0_9STRA|nr:hypothetical protein IV203_020781 [Nitzschia inconspicua]